MSKRQKKISDEVLINEDAYQFEALDLTTMREQLHDDLLHKEIILVPSEARRTSERLMQAELTAVLSLRAKHLENGAAPFVDTGNEYDHTRIAYMEILARKCPMMIRRTYSNGFMVEVWEVNEMVLPFN